MPSYSFLCIFAAVCLSANVSESVVAASTHAPRDNIDHLIPVGQMVGVAYQRLLARNLYLTPANYARIVVLPSGSSSGETALSLYSKLKKDDEVVLTWTKGERDLWSAASELDSTLREDPQVKIRRLDVHFPKLLATSISKALRQLIKQSREPASTDRMVVDGTHILYIVEETGGRSLHARLTPESEGKTTAALRKLTLLLQEYCQVPLEKRMALEKKMESEVRRLTHQ